MRTGSGEISPFFNANSACSNWGTISPLPTSPRSPPRGAVPESSRDLLGQLGEVLPGLRPADGVGDLGPRLVLRLAAARLGHADEDVRRRAPGAGSRTPDVLGVVLLDLRVGDRRPGSPSGSASRTARAAGRAGGTRPGAAARYAASSSSVALAPAMIGASSTSAHAARTSSRWRRNACSSSASETLTPVRTAASTFARVSSRRISPSNAGGGVSAPLQDVLVALEREAARSPGRRESPGSGRSAPRR